MRSEIGAVRVELTTPRADMATSFRDLEQRMTIRLGGMLVVMTGILLAAKFSG